MPKKLKILAEPFASGDVLREKSERLTTLRDDLNQEAMEAAKSGNKPQRTFYFEMAKLKKNARTISKSTLEKAEGKKKAEISGNNNLSIARSIFQKVLDKRHDFGYNNNEDKL